MMSIVNAIGSGLAAIFVACWMGVLSPFRKRNPDVPPEDEEDD